jgi:MYXO-CTERM domain-containing protein
MNSFKLILSALLMTAPSMMAASISYDGNFVNDPGSYPFIYTSSVPKFNPSLGVLESVVFSLNAASTANVEMESEGPVAGEGSARLFGVVTGNFSGLNTSVFLSKVLVDNVGSDDEVGGPDFTGVDYKNFGVLNDSKSGQDSAESNLTAYIGSGGIDVTITDNQAWSVSGTGDSASRVTLSQSNTHWEVTYTFSPAPLPEPSSIVMGMAGLVGLRLRRRRAQ